MNFPDQLTIETPEQTALEFPLAGLGSRFLALAIDTLIQGAAALALFLTAVSFFPLLRLLGSISQWVGALLILGGFLIYSAYFAFFEAIWNGQTPGKRLIQLRVMKDDGRPIGAYDAITRNLVRIIDQLPGIYAVGIVTILFSRQSKRLGDHVAGTVVVHEKTLRESRPFAATAAAPGPGPALDVSHITLEEFQLLEAFLQRRESLETSVRRAMAIQIISRLAPKLGVEPEPWPKSEAQLAAALEQVRARGLRQ
jgi:uncharacterized RDD family membrane protein YckC